MGPLFGGRATQQKPLVWLTQEEGAPYWGRPPGGGKEGEALKKAEGRPEDRWTKWRGTGNETTVNKNKNKNKKERPKEADTLLDIMRSEAELIFVNVIILLY